MFKTPLAGKLEGREVSRRIRSQASLEPLTRSPHSRDSVKDAILKVTLSLCPIHSMKLCPRERKRDKVQGAGWEVGNLRFHPSSSPKGILPPPLPWFFSVLSEKMALGDPEGPHNLSGSELYDHSLMPRARVQDRS